MATATKTSTARCLNSAAILKETAGYMAEVRAGARADLAAAQDRLAAAGTDEAKTYAAETVRLCKSALRSLR